MPEGLAGGETRQWIPVQTLLYEVSKSGVLAALERSAPLLAARGTSHLAAAGAGPRQHGGPRGQGVGSTVAWVALGVDEVLCPFGLFQHFLWRHAQQLHDTGQLVALVLAGEQRVPGQQLGQYAAKTPHVDRKAIPRAEDHLWSSVEARLDVGVHPLVLKAAGAKINHLVETERQVGEI